MIEARGLTRRYGDFTAVRDVSFSVADGEILGILGPNGAGKTTTIRMITGFLPPTEGSVTLGGQDLHENPIEARRHLGYLPENVALYGEMRVVEYLTYRAKLAGLRRSGARDAIDRSIDACLLEGVRFQIINTLSKGYRQRVGLAAAILHGPRVLVLDEPTVGLDPKQIIAIRELIRELGRERTLLLSTHILPEVEQLCDRVVIIDRGRLIAEGTPQDLARRTREQRAVWVTVQDPPDRVAQTFAGLPGVAAVDVDAEQPGRFRLSCELSDIDPREHIFKAAVSSDLVLLELAEQRFSLEDVFVRLTTSQRSEPELAADKASAAATAATETDAIDSPESTPGDDA